MKKLPKLCDKNYDEIFENFKFLSSLESLLIGRRPLPFCILPCRSIALCCSRFIKTARAHMFSRTGLFCQNTGLYIC